MSKKSFKTQADPYADMTAEELKITFLRKISNDVHEIKNCCLFFFTLTLIGGLGYIFILLMSAIMPK